MAKRIGGYKASNNNYKCLIRNIVCKLTTQRVWETHCHIGNLSISRRNFRELWLDCSLRALNTRRMLT